MFLNDSSDVVQLRRVVANLALQVLLFSVRLEEIEMKYESLRQLFIKQPCVGGGDVENPVNPDCH